MTKKIYLAIIIFLILILFAVIIGCGKIINTESNIKAKDAAININYQKYKNIYYGFSLDRPDWEPKEEMAYSDGTWMLTIKGPTQSTSLDAYGAIFITAYKTRPNGGEYNTLDEMVNAKIKQRIGIGYETPLENSSILVQGLPARKILIQYPVIPEGAHVDEPFPEIMVKCGWTAFMDANGKYFYEIYFNSLDSDYATYLTAYNKMVESFIFQNFVQYNY